MRTVLSVFLAACFAMPVAMAARPQQPRGRTPTTIARASYTSPDPQGHIRIVLVSSGLAGITFRWNLMRTAEDELFAGMEGKELRFTLELFRNIRSNTVSKWRA